MADRDLHHLIGRDLPSQGGDARRLSIGPGDRIGPLRQGAIRTRRDKLTFAAAMLGLTLAASAATLGAVIVWSGRPKPTETVDVAARIVDFPPPAEIVPPPPSAFETIPMSDLPSKLPSQPVAEPPAQAALPPPVPLDGPPVPAVLRPEPKSEQVETPGEPVLVPQPPVRPAPAERASKVRPHDRPKPPQAAQRPPFKPQSAVEDVEATGSHRPLPAPSRKPPTVAAKEPTAAASKEPSTWNLPSVLRPGGL